MTKIVLVDVFLSSRGYIMLYVGQEHSQLFAIFVFKGSCCAAKLLVVTAVHMYSIPSMDRQERASSSLLMHYLRNKYMFCICCDEDLFG